MNIPTNTEPWIQGAAIGVIALAIVGITWGDWRHDDLRRTSPTPRMTPWSRPSHHLRRAFPGAARRRCEDRRHYEAGSWDRGNKIEKSVTLPCPAARRPLPTSRAPAPRSWRPPRCPRAEERGLFPRSRSKFRVAASRGERPKSTTSF